MVSVVVQLVLVAFRYVHMASSGVASRGHRGMGVASLASDSETERP